MRMDFEKTILCFIEPRHVIELRRLHQSPRGIIAPAVIPATEHGGGAALFTGDGVRAVTADVVEGADLVIFSFDEEDGEAGNVEGLVGAWFGELRFVG